MSTEVSRHAAFSSIRYAQVWEDAEVLLEGLAIRPGAECLSIASAGDNALAMLIHEPSRVVAVDLNPAQIACLKLRIAAFRCLEHHELLALVGSVDASPVDRLRYYQTCRPTLDQAAKEFWDAHPGQVSRGIGGCGKFEHYFRIFRKWILPLAHPRRRVARLLTPSGPDERRRFFDEEWDSLRWRLLFRVFFSRRLMGMMGRDKAFFRYVDEPVAEQILKRARHALSELDPSGNPYLRWILTGRHEEALPLYLRPQHFETIRQRVDRIEPFVGTLEDCIESQPSRSFDAYNLSDIFEYMSEDNSDRLFGRLLGRARAGARLVHWNMMVPRRCPTEEVPIRVRHLSDLSHQLQQKDQAFFYRQVHVNEVEAV